MKKFIYAILISAAIIFSILIIFNVYWPFANGFINSKQIMGDAAMHLANIIGIQRDHPFPILAWKPEWAGYPLIEGYPWVHYYIIQGILPFFHSQGVAMDYYMSVFLLVYYVIAFLLLFYVSRNVFLALFFTLVLIYGADSQLPLSVNAFMTFVGTQFFLPLILFFIILGRDKNNTKLFLIAAILLAIAFYAHGSMTGIVIMPIIIPFLIFNHEGKITKHSIFNTIRFFLVFSLISSIQIYQFIDYNAQGYLRGIKPFSLDIIPGRFIDLMSWENPILLPLLILFVPFFIIISIKSFSKIKVYFSSFIFIIFIFTLMLFNITSMNLVLLAERVLWGMDLSFLLLFSIVIFNLNLGKIKQIIIGAVSLVSVGTYLYFTLVVKPPHLVPDTLRPFDPYKYITDKTKAPHIDSNINNYKTKYDQLYSYSPPLWSKNFDNYRTDGISWAIYSNWNIWSSNPRYKGRFPAAKGLSLDWSGLVTASQYGKLGEAGTSDNSKWALSRTMFFSDWYAIRHLEIGENDPDFTSYLKKKPVITNIEIKPGVDYYNIGEKYVGPLYAPTNAPLMAIIAPKAQYDASVRTLSYSEFTSRRLIPIYLGSSLGALNQDNLKYFDAVFLYGYKTPFFGGNTWNLLDNYVNNGGKLIIETGQKVSETQDAKLPQVFPVEKTNLFVAYKSFNIEFKDKDLTKEAQSPDFTPLKTKYLPYGLSEASSGSLRDWAKPVLIHDGNIVMAYGQLGKGTVVWSGLNLPFHAIDNRNTSETVIFSNILNMFFPKNQSPIEDFKVSHPTNEKIIVSASKGKGFLIKENYNPGWSAKLNGQSVKILKAGLFEMYIPFDKSGVEQALELNYHGNPLHWVLFAISSVSLIGTLIYICFNINPLISLRGMLGILPKKLPKSLLKTEEEDY